MPNLSKQQQITDIDKDLGLVIINVLGLFSLDFLLYLAKPTTIIDHYAPVEKGEMTDKYTTKHLTLTSTFDLELDL